MKYTDEEFQKLLKRAGDEGAILLDEICGMREYEFTGEETKNDPPVVLPGCGNVSIFEVPYKRMKTVGKNKVEELGTVKLCAVCDNLGSIARFA